MKNNKYDEVKNLIPAPSDLYYMLDVDNLTGEDYTTFEKVVALGTVEGTTDNLTGFISEGDYYEDVDQLRGEFVHLDDTQIGYLKQMELLNNCQSNDKINNMINKYKEEINNE